MTLSQRAIGLEVFCWFCGTEGIMIFTFNKTVPVGFRQGMCGKCGEKTYINKGDLLEVKQTRISNTKDLT